MTASDPPGGAAPVPARIDAQRPEKGGCGGCTGGGGGCGSKASAGPPSVVDGKPFPDAKSMIEAKAVLEAPPVKTDPCGLPLSSGDMARGCETTIRTVRFYEEAGLIEPVARSEGGHRMYSPEQLLKLQLIMDLREAGLSLQDIKALFELKHRFDNAEAASKEMADVLEAQIECMQRKIAVLRRLREELACMVATIRECENCEAPDFKKQCGGCDVMARPDLPRAMRLLWGSGRE
ncbi:MerR family transcriptional regulator [Sandaracinus amylolyticus]|uniref:helix-turn-helix domain-containing protein n=1 Tax=Sandaracinus amylolyticus TaxID=927083 RepID=UPI001F2D2DA9|nr:MerR family transcriptional regulator [Sandaracinus amylolyticus]